MNEHNNYSPELAEAVTDCLKNVFKWHYIFDEEEGVLQFDVSSRRLISHIHYVIHLGIKRFTVHAYCPVTPDMSDKDQVARVSEYIHRLNYGLPVGNMEFDYNDGEIRFKVTQRCGHEAPEPQTVFSAIHAASEIYKKYGKGLIEMMYGTATPEKAIEAAERKDSDVGIPHLQQILSALRDIKASKEGGAEESDAEQADTEEPDGDSSDLSLPDTFDADCDSSGQAATDSDDGCE